MPVTCPNYRENVLPQTLFLGASVVSFSSNAGWGSRASSVTVELIEDFQPSVFSNIPHYTTANYPANHYYNCNGDNCYVDELGRPYSSSPTKKEKNIPGKVYYSWIGNVFASNYWIYEDPGFLATGTKIQPNGSVNRNGPINVYDIIDTPVYFKFDNFEFIGLVKSWTREARPGGITYSVTIESLDVLLSQCQVILQDFDGPVSDQPNSTLANGNISNIINVYGFLESMGVNQFGGAALSNNGISAKSVLDSIQILTASISRYARPIKDQSYSPFGRILSKSIRRISSNGSLVNEPHIQNMNTFGIICASNPARSFNNIPYNSFSLDLSSIPNPPFDYRISANPSDSISSIIETVIQDTGLDYLAVTVPVRVGQGIEFVIKILTVDRTQYNPIYQIPAAVTSLENAGFNVENASFGQESNQNNIRKVVFGGNQQRYFQAKTYRLPYAQNNYIYNPIINRFVNNRRSISKGRNPSLDSNKITSIIMDSTWTDDQVDIPNHNGVLRGNYSWTKKFNNNPRSRYIPLFRDIICPYFGTKLDVTYEPVSDSNIFRFVRPVYLDSWTNQIVIGFDINELPQLSIGDPLTLYQPDVANNNAGIGAAAGPIDPAQLGQGFGGFGSTPSSPPVGGGGTGGGDTDTGGDGASEGNTDNGDIGEEQSPPATADAAPEDPSPLDKLPPVDPPTQDELGRQRNQANQGPALPTTGQQIIANNITTNDRIRILEDEPPAPDDNAAPASKSPALPENPEPSTDETQAAEEASQTKPEDAVTGQPNVPRGPSRSRAKNSSRNTTRTRIYRPAGFTIKETELRCPTFDSYLTYCLGKSTFSKPDLFVMLVNAYKAKGIFFASPPPSQAATQAAAYAGGGLTTNSANIGATTTSVEDGVLAEPRESVRTKMAMNWDIYLNHNFIKDLQILYNFIKNLSDKYYGKQFMVKLPDIYAYKDTTYLDVALPGTNGSFFVYQGSQEIKFNYELADGAWEEPGNYIDDTFTFGDSYWHSLKNDDGLFPALAGYNNSLNIDDVTTFWRSLPLAVKQRILSRQAKINGNRTVLSSTNTTLSPLITRVVNIQREILDIQQRLTFNNIGAPAPVGGGVGASPPPQGTNAELRERLKELLEELLPEAVDELSRGLQYASDADKQAVQAEIKAFNAELGFNLGDLLSGLIGEAPGSLYYQYSLDISNLDPGSFITINTGTTKDAFNRTVPASKLYTKAEAVSLVFLNPINLSDCRAIVQVSDAIGINSTSNSYISDPALTIISNVAAEDLAILAYSGLMEQAQQALLIQQAQAGNPPQQQAPIPQNLIDLSFYIDYLFQYIIPPIDLNRIAVKGATNTKSTSHDVISPRRATPLFIGVPIKSNNKVYGPWTNSPPLTLPANLSNNLFGNTKVEQNSDYVPWKYGNIQYLEQVVRWAIAYDTNYQSVLENGRVTIAGPPIFGIGGSFNPNAVSSANLNSVFDNTAYAIASRIAVFYDANLNRFLHYKVLLVNSSNDYGFPIISNISIQNTEAGMKTSYSFQTYNPRTGLFNKELTDRSRALNDRLSKFNQKLNSLATKVSNKNLLDKLNILENARSNREPYSIDSKRTRFYGTSPVELIIGQAQQHLNISPREAYDPANGWTYHSGIIHNIRHHHWAGIIVGDEIGSELLDDYDTKASMSLDGLLSPVSFYPTRNSSTYNISTLITGSGTDFGFGNNLPNLEGLVCPKCNNSRHTLIYNRNGTPLGSPLRIPCSMCCRSKVEVEKLDKKIENKGSLPDINMYSLNPIVVPSGEFRNPYASNDDVGRHSILAISRGSYPPTNNDNFLLHANFQVNQAINKDYHVYDIDRENTTSQKTLNNQRFMALRGPLMLHGWGFDTDGYPVPNANDMPYAINSNGLLLRFTLVANRYDKKFAQNDLDWPGAFLPEENGNPLGDVITLQYEWKGTGNGTSPQDRGRWVKKSSKSKYFHLNWAQRQDLWPVGPVDLRWDPKRRVWDASGGCKEEILPPFIVTNSTDVSTLQEFLENKTDSRCPYRDIYVTLENDMIREDAYDSTYATRGFIDDIEYNKEPLQNGYRRLVYVMDKTGYTAPRGTKLLCRYDRLSGFYEPISKPSVTAIGTISSGNAASIRAHYIQGRRAGIAPNFVVTYSNPLGFRITSGNNGIFTFINGKWTLSSTT